MEEDAGLLRTVAAGHRPCQYSYRARIVETMAKEGLKKEDIGREKFLERAWEWKGSMAAG